MNPEDLVTTIKNALNEQLLSDARSMVNTSKNGQVWQDIVKKGLMPDIPEAVQSYFSSNMWPWYIVLPLNKKLVSEVCQRFEDLGWKVEPWEVGASSLDVTIRPKRDWGWDVPYHFYIRLQASGEGQDCKLVVIEQHTETKTVSTYELVCAEGAEEMAKE